MVPANPGHQGLKPAAIGDGVRVKINANIGTSPHDINLEKEQAKLAAALEYGAHAVMDLSTGGDLDAIRTALLGRCPAPFGTVPIYQLMTEAHSLEDVKADDLLEMVRHHARQGVDFVTVHCGVTRAALPLLEKAGHRGGLPGRGLPHRLDAPLSAGKIPCTKNTTSCWTSPGNTTSPCPWGTACAPAAWPTPPIRPNCTN